MHIELTKDKRNRWFWRVVSGNSQTILVSQAYATRWSATRSATKLAKANGYELRYV